MACDEAWPNVSDPRLLAVLKAQVAGSLLDLRQCTEDGLEHLASIMDTGPDEASRGLVLSALTDMQRIDRVMQRLQNVVSSLEEWERACDEPDAGTPAWLDLLIGRYVMPEERTTVHSVLNDD